MYEVTFFDEPTGRIGIAMSFSTPELLLANTQNKPYVPGRYDPDAHYIHNSQPTPRPASPISRSGLTLSNVPAGATLTIDGTHYSAQGTVDLSFPLPGTYALRVECFPYLDWTDEVTV